MKYTVIVFLLLSVAIIPGCSSDNTVTEKISGIEVSEGTPLRVTLVTPLSSSISERGDTFSAVLKKQISFNKKVLLPEKTEIRGLVKRSVKISSTNNEALLLLIFDQVVLPDATKIPIAASLKTTEGPGVIKIKGGNVKELRIVSTGSLVGYLIGKKTIDRDEDRIVTGSLAASGAVLISKGTDITLPQGTEFLIKLDEPLIIPR